MSNSKKDEKQDKILDSFEDQDKQFDFRDRDLKKYRNKAKKVIGKNIDKRLSKIQKKEFFEEKITKEKLDKRTKPYGEKPIIFKFEKRKKKFVYVARNRKTGKILSFIPEQKNKSEKQHQKILSSKLDKKDFDYNKLYVPEDTESERKTDKRPSVTISYTTFYRYGILIYELKKGKKYKIIFQTSNSQARSVYVAYQRIIAQLKEDVLIQTGFSIEEWIFLSRKTNNIFVEGGITYKRFKGIKIADGSFKQKLDFEIRVDFDDF